MFRILFLLLIGFASTVLIELLVANFFGFKSKNERKTVVLASVITYFILNFIIGIVTLFIRGGNSETDLVYYIYVTVLEVGIVIAEYYIIKYVYSKKHGNKKIMWLAITMNVASYLLGIFILNPFFDFLVNNTSFL